MKIQDILNFKIVDTKELEITVYSILIALVIFIVTKVILFILRRFFKKQIQPRFDDIGKSQAIFQIIRYVVWIIAIALILETIGVKITILIAGSAALLVGIGLGIQQIFNDIISGIFLLFEGTIKVGDVVETEGDVGKVVQIGLRTSKIETRDNIIVIVPNSRFISEKVINWSHMDRNTRFSVEVGVAYGSDVRLVESLLLQVAANHKEVSANPKPFVRFNNFGESSLDFSLYFWTSKTFEVENLKSDLRFMIDDAFRSNGVEIPFPQRDVHLKK